MILYDLLRLFLYCLEGAVGLLDTHAEHFGNPFFVTLLQRGHEIIPLSRSEILDGPQKSQGKGHRVRIILDLVTQCHRCSFGKGRLNVFPSPRSFSSSPRLVRTESVSNAS